MYEPAQVRLSYFLDDGRNDLTTIEELEPKLAPDQQTTGFLERKR